jgi:hypothetical protein
MVMKIQKLVMQIQDGHENSRWSWKFKMWACKFEKVATLCFVPGGYVPEWHFHRKRDLVDT